MRRELLLALDAGVDMSTTASEGGGGCFLGEDLIGAVDDAQA